MTPDVLSNIIPGCKKFEQIGDNEYKAVMMIKVGPVQGDFQGAITLADIKIPTGYTMHMEGKGQAGFMKGVGQVRLEEQGNSTVMHYGGEAHVGGRIASIGQRLMDSTAKAMTKQGLDGLQRQVTARLAAPAGNGAGKPGLAISAQKVEAPGQVEFAIGVAKNMLEDMLPPERQRLLIGASLGLVLLGFLLNCWINTAARRAVNEALKNKYQT